MREWPIAFIILNLLFAAMIGLCMVKCLLHLLLVESIACRKLSQWTCGVGAQWFEILYVQDSYFVIDVTLISDKAMIGSFPMYQGRI